MKKLNFLLIFVALFISSCNNQFYQEPSQTIQYETYRQTQSDLFNNLNNMATFARNNGYTLNSREAILKTGEAYYGTKNNLLKDFQLAVYRTLPLGNTRVSNLEGFEQAVIDELSSALQTAESSEVFLNYLDDELLAYAESNLGDDEKTYAMTKIAYFGAYVQYIDENQDLLVPSLLANGRTTTDGDEDDEGWWSSWGKCTVGSALVGVAAGIAAAGTEIVTLGAGTPVAIGILVAAGTWMIEC